MQNNAENKSRYIGEILSYPIVRRNKGGEIVTEQSIIQAICNLELKNPHKQISKVIVHKIKVDGLVVEAEVTYMLANDTTEDASEQYYLPLLEATLKTKD